MKHGLIASILNTTRVFSGYLAFLKNDLTSKLPENKTWGNVKGIKGIVGEPIIYNVHPTPHLEPPSWYEIYFGDKYIVPSAYFLMGRRNSYANLLKSWNFSGKTINNEWKVLHSVVDKQFSFYENRTYILKGNEPYKAFKLEMTKADSNNAWALCVGQIEVFGNIYDTPYIPLNGVFHYTKACVIRSRNFLFFLILIQS